MTANMKQSYDVTIECRIEGTSIESQNTLDLKNPYFRYTGVQPQPPPGENNQSPSELYWTQVDLAGARQAVNLVNGMIVDGLGHVSLDSQPVHPVAAVNNIQPNIHQGTQFYLIDALIKSHFISLCTFFSSINCGQFFKVSSQVSGRVPTNTLPALVL